MNELATLDNNTDLTVTMSHVNEFVSNAKASNTLKAYQSDWNHFTSWCEAHNLQPLPAYPETIAAYIVSLVETGLKTSTLERRLVSISKACTTAGVEDASKSALVKEVWAGIKRTVGTSQQGKNPVMLDDLKVMLEVIPDNLLGVRDRALLLLGFAGGFRRSELVSLDIEDIEFSKLGMTVNLRHSKTDQEGRGRQIGIPYGRPETCAARAVQLWIEASGIESGPLFRSVNRHGNLQQGRLCDKAVALVVKKYCEAVGLNPETFGGHSLRAGLATSAAMAGASERQIMKQTGHKSEAMVRKYIRQGSLFTDNVCNSLL